MITQLFIFYIVIATLVAFTNWRLGLFLMLVAGMLQDPIRKLTLGAPAIMVLSFVPIWAAMVVNAMSAHPAIWRRFRHLNPGVASALWFLLLAILLATLVVLRHGSSAWLVAMIGLMGYLLPIIAMVIGFFYVRRVTDLNKLIVFYCVLTAILLIGTVLEYRGILPGWQALGTSALNVHWVRYISWGHTIELIAGFYRSPDVMGWHAATLVMLSLTMLLYGKHGPRWAWLLLILWGVLCVLLSGRNKMIFMPIVWGIVVASVYIYVGRGAKVVYLAMIGGLVILGLAVASGQLGVEEDYFLHSAPTVGKVLERVERHSIGGVIETYRQAGFFGEGIGTASQGRQYAGASVARTWQEGGIPKLLVELGVLGLLSSLILVVALFKALHLTVNRVHPRAPQFSLHAGILGLVAANAASFIISHQAYGDALIVTMAAFFLGVALSTPSWYAQRKR